MRATDIPSHPITEAELADALWEEEAPTGAATHQEPPFTYDEDQQPSGE